MSYDPSVYDPRNPNVIQNPIPALRYLQQHDPVHWSNSLKAWVITRYDDCKFVALDGRFSAERMKAFFAYLPEDKREKVRHLEWSIGLWTVFLDPPDHTRLRKLMNRGFTSSALRDMTPRIAALVDELLDDALSRNDGTMDFTDAFAYPLPALVIMDLLAAPRERLEDFKRWSEELVLFVGGALVTESKYRRAERATTEMIDCFRDLISDRRRHPGDDMISALIAAEEAGDVLSEEELVANCILLLFAGHETTRNLLANGLLHLIRNPDQAQRLREEPRLAASAVEEMLRIEGPSGAMMRVATENVEMHGVTIRTGERVYIMQNAANHDSSVFPDPERFDIGRENNRQITFGHGIHFCIGAPLARLEATIAFPRILARMKDIHLMRDEPDWMDSVIFRGMRTMPIGYHKIVS
jgi:cytochrome P450